MVGKEYGSNKKFDLLAFSQIFHLKIEFKVCINSQFILNIVSKILYDTFGFSFYIDLLKIF